MLMPPTVQDIKGSFLSTESLFEKKNFKQNPESTGH